MPILEPVKPDAPPIHTFHSFFFSISTRMIRVSSTMKSTSASTFKAYLIAYLMSYAPSWTNYSVNRPIMSSL